MNEQNLDIRSSLSIDWIAYTYHYEDKDAAIEYFTVGRQEKGLTAFELWKDYVSDVSQTFGGIWVEDKGLYGYEYGATHNTGVRVLWSDDLRMGVHVIFSGQALSGRNAIEIIRTAWSFGAKFTRIDVCYDDVSEAPTTVRDYAKLYESREYEGRTRTSRQVTDSTGGHTLYIGSRTSERMMRIYDKGAERGLGNDWWVRHEIELKGDAAKGAAQYIGFYADDDLDLSAILTNFINFPNTTAYENMSDAEIDIKWSDKGERKTQEWGIIAAKAIAKQIKLDTGYAKEIERAFAAAGVNVSIETQPLDN